MTADAVGGVWTYVRTLVEALHPAVECTVALLGPEPPATLSHPAHARVHAYPCRLEWMHAPWSDVRASGAWLQGLARRLRPDVVHVNGYAHAALPFDAPVLVGAHSCVCSWWRAVHGVAAPREWDTYRDHVRQGLSAATLVVAPTRAMLAALVAEHGALSRSAVVHNGAAPVDTGGTKAPLVVSIGRAWDEAKNLQVLARAARGLPWTVAVLGPVTGPGHATATLPGVLTLGAQPPHVVSAWLERAQIYAHPARYEPFGLAVLEAAQAGCALVLADLPSLREVWGESAVYVAPDDAAAWHDALAALMSDGARTRALGAAARRAATRYTAESMATEYARLYAGLSTTSCVDPEPRPQARAVVARPVRSAIPGARS